MTAAEPHGRIDVLTGGVVGLQHPHGIVEVAEQQGVGDEAGPVPGDNGGLADLRDQHLKIRQHRRVRHHRTDDLYKAHHRRRVEPVGADDPRGPGRAGGQLGDRQ